MVKQIQAHLAVPLLNPVKGSGGWTGPTSWSHTSLPLISAITESLNSLECPGCAWKTPTLAAIRPFSIFL